MSTVTATVDPVALAAVGEETGADAEGLFAPGVQLGRYHLGRRLAQGGMSDVWRASAMGVEGFRREIVIKTMRPEAAREAGLVRLFVNEAAIAARLHHPGVVQVFDFGRLEGRYFIAMEYVPGATLRQLARGLRRRGLHLPRPFVVRRIMEIARALGYAHALCDGGGLPLGLVHGDVSPENIMVSFASVARLIDFGASSTAAVPLPPGMFVGKIRYLAPERLRGRRGDGRADVYALGIILYEYLTGRRPYDGPDPAHRMAEPPPPDPCAVRPELPQTAGAVIRRAMALDPDQRYGTADQLAEGLRALLRASLGRDPQAASAAEVNEVLNPPEPPGAEPDPVGESADETPSLRLLSPMPAAGPLAMLDASPRQPLPLGSPSPAPTAATATAASPATAASRLPPLSPPPRLPPPRLPPPRLSPPPPPWKDLDAITGSDAVTGAACFERGLALVGLHRLAEALVYWQRAAELDPGRRSYQSNLARLQARIAAGQEEAPAV